MLCIVSSCMYVLNVKQDNVADQYHILQHTDVDIINCRKLGSMFNAACSLVKTELPMQLLQWVRKLQLIGRTSITEYIATNNDYNQTDNKQTCCSQTCWHQFYSALHALTALLTAFSSAVQLFVLWLHVNHITLHYIKFRVQESWQLAEERQPGRVVRVHGCTGKPWRRACRISAAAHEASAGDRAAGWYVHQCTVHTVQCTVHTVQCTVHTVPCTVHTVYWTETIAEEKIFAQTDVCSTVAVHWPMSVAVLLSQQRLNPIKLEYIPS